jgi:hypothetical protein
LGRRHTTPATAAGPRAVTDTYHILQHPATQCCDYCFGWPMSFTKAKRRKYIYISFKFIKLHVYHFQCSFFLPLYSSYLYWHFLPYIYIS